MEASNVTIVKLIEQEKKGEKVETKEALKSAKRRRCLSYVVSAETE